MPTKRNTEKQAARNRDINGACHACKCRGAVDQAGHTAVT